MLVVTGCGQGRTDPSSSESCEDLSGPGEDPETLVPGNLEELLLLDFAKLISSGSSRAMP